MSSTLGEVKHLPTLGLMWKSILSGPGNRPKTTSMRTFLLHLHPSSIGHMMMPSGSMPSATFHAVNFALSLWFLDLGLNGPVTNVSGRIAPSQIGTCKGLILQA